MTVANSSPCRGLSGETTVPGDKSISHRSLMLGALAVGRTEVRGLLEGEDVLATAEAMRAMGATVTRVGEGHWQVDGVGVGGLGEPATALDMGNSGTSARLLMGLVASHPITATFTGDPSLSRRPMGRIIDPLRQIGAQFTGRDGGRLPLTVTGASEPLPIDYAPPMASAQVKSAVLLAGLNTPGITRVTEITATRDHSERMLRAMGADVRSQTLEDGRHQIDLTGQPDLTPISLTVPGDISSAAFPLVAALLVPGSEIMIRNVGMNPLRTGILDALDLMGADVRRENESDLCGEPVADLLVRATNLKAIDLDPAIASRLIDECPILFVAAACAAGTSRFTGLEELRVKESDRLAAMAAALSANGVVVEETEDGLIIEGCAGPVPGNGMVTTHLDHRIAMAGLVMGMAAQKAVTIDDSRPIGTSFPGFVAMMNRLGGQMGDS